MPGRAGQRGVSKTKKVQVSFWWEEMGRTVIKWSQMSTIPHLASKQKPAEEMVSPQYLMVSDGQSIMNVTTGI